MTQNRDFKFKHKCIHDQIVEEEQQYLQQQQEIIDYIEKLPKFQHKISDNWQPIRLNVNYENIDNKGIPQQDINFIKAKLIPAVIAYFESTFYVQQLQNPIKPSKYYTKSGGKCGKTHLPRSLYGGVDNVDMIILINAEYSKTSNFLAYASKCYQGEQELKSKRPTIGKLVLNSYYLEKSMNTKRWFTWIETGIHEMMHAMGFSQNSFKYFKNGKIFKSSTGQHFFSGPNVTKFGQKYFDCQSVDGVPLENNGGSGSAGSHWERVALGNEGMTASDFGDAVYSKFTLNLFLDSGWYQFNENYAQQLVWEKGTGCFTMSGHCDRNRGEHSCNKGQKGCNFDFTSPGYCTFKDKFEPQCPYLKGYKNTVCTSSTQFLNQYKRLGGNVSDNSRCWDIVEQNKYKKSLIHNACYESKCSNGIMKVKINQTWKTCQGEGSTVYHNGIKLKCPNKDKFCGVESNCPNSCTAQGTCVNGQCLCYKGYSGQSCQNRGVQQLILANKIQINNEINDYKNKLKNIDTNFCDIQKQDYLGFNKSTNNYYCCNSQENLCCNLYQTPNEGKCQCQFQYLFNNQNKKCEKQ